jgi:hypothetical protein
MRPIPLTTEQLFIYWVMRTLGEDTPALHVATSLRLKGNVDAGRLERAAAELIARNPGLNARFTDRGEPAQRLGDGSAAVEVIELAGAPETEVNKVLSGKADELFDVTADCPLRIVLARTAPEENFLLFAGHHLFIDKIGLHIALEDYLRLASDRSPAPPDNGGRSFFDYAELQHRLISEGTYARRAQSWIDEFSQADPVLHIAGRGPDPVVESTRALHLEAGPEVWSGLANRARQLRVTPFALVLSAIYESVRECTSQDGLVASIVTDTRRHPFGRTVGQFAELFLMQQRRADRGLGETALRGTFRQAAAALKNYVPPGFVAEGVGWLMDRMTSGYTMSDVFINYHPPTASADTFSRLTGTEASPFQLLHRHEPDDLRFHGRVLGFDILPGPSGVRGEIQYERTIIGDSLARDICAALHDALCRITNNERNATSSGPRA